VRRTRLHAPQAQSVTFVELFFDLVFVFAVTQITTLTASHLTWTGIARSVLLFWLIWWAWTQFTWTLNPADTYHNFVRVLTLVATGAAFIMATSVTRAFGDEVLWFVVPYLVVRVLGLGLQVRIDLEHDVPRHRTVVVWAGLSVVGLAIVLAGAFVDPPARNWIWLLAIGADLFAAGFGGRGQDWDLNPAHFSERHGLFVIIALGESLIVAATAVSSEDLSAELMAVVVAALVVACLLWWTYFGWLKDALEHGLASAGAARLGRLARDAFSLAHFPLVCGIIGFAVYVEEIVHHPAAVPAGEVVAALGAGVGLFVGVAVFAYWRACRRLLVPRLVILGVTIGALAVVSGHEPLFQLGVVAIGLVAIVMIEARTPGNSMSDDSMWG